MDLRTAINLVERFNVSEFASVTPENVIAYCRDPKNADVHPLYMEQIDFAFDGDQDALDAWVVSMIDDIKQKITRMVKNNRYMYRGFKNKPTEPLGVHWTTDKKIAEMFAQGGFVLTAYIDTNIIDWLGTVVRGIFWDNDAEEELFLISGSQVVLYGGRKKIV